MREALPGERTFGLPASRAWETRGFLAPALGRPVLAFLLSVLAVFAGSRPASAAIEYRIFLDHPAEHEFHVSMTVSVQGRELVTALPAWNALYRVLDFAHRVGPVRAACLAPAPVALRKRLLDKQTWQFSLDGTCQPDDHNRFQIDYTIEWNAPGPFGSQLDSRHAFMNLGEMLMYVPDRRNEDVSVEFADLPAGWRTAAELAAARGDNTYVAASYDRLVDAPVEAGKFEEFQFTESGGRFRVIVDSPSWNKPFLEDTLHRITRYELTLMRGAPFDPPNREYTFFFHIAPDGDDQGGGMEHRNSTAISAKSVETAAVVAAHEFFHVWNVKRIRPQSLEPIDYTKEQYTRALWFAEGVTSTYAAYALERTGLWSKAQFFADLAAQIGELQSRPSRAWQSVEDSSFEAWFEKYDGYNAPERSISYYNKGQILGVLLDLAVRDATDNRKSLDDVLRRMYAEYAEQGEFYDDSPGLRSVVEEVAGKSFEDFFKRYVSGTDEIPYNELLSAAGLEVKMSAARTSIGEVAHPTDRQRRILEGLLRGTTN